jgi:hypothetical protein
MMMTARIETEIELEQPKFLPIVRRHERGGVLWAWLTEIGDAVPLGIVPDNILVNVLRRLARHIDEAVHDAIAHCLGRTVAPRSEESERNRPVSPPIAAYMAGEMDWVMMDGVRAIFVGKTDDWIDAVRFLVAEADRRGLGWEMPQRRRAAEISSGRKGDRGEKVMHRHRSKAAPSTARRS